MGDSRLPIGHKLFSDIDYKHMSEFNPKDPKSVKARSFFEKYVKGNKDAREKEEK